MDNVLRILIVEDLPSDADLAKREITAALSSCVFEVVETQEDYLAAIKKFHPDLIVSDYTLPHFDGLTAMKLAQQHAPMVPFIMLTGSMNEETAVECMKAGATDYVIKEHIKRLGLAVVSALEQKRTRLEKERAEAEERTAQNELRESEERYRSFFDNSIDAVLLTSPDGSVLKANAEACRIFDYTEEELCQVGRNGIVDTSDPRLSIALEERNRTGKFKGELTFIRKDGTRFPGELSNAVFKDKNGALRTSLIIRDTTERTQAEETLKISEIKYRNLHESMMDGFVSVGMDGMIKEFNESYRQMLGYTPEELLKLTYRDITPEKWHTFEQKIVERQIVTRGYSEVYEKEYRRKDGTIFPVELRTFLIKDETGSNVGMWGIVRDITERKRGEETLQKSEEQAKQLAQENSIVAEIGRIISSTLSIEEVYKSFVEKVRELIPFDRIAIGLINAEQNTVSFPYIEGLFVPGREPGDTVPLVGLTAEKMLQTNSGMIIAMESEEEIAAWVPGLLPEFRCGIRSALTVPLISGDRAIGRSGRWLCDRPSLESIRNEI